MQQVNRNLTRQGSIWIVLGALFSVSILICIIWAYQDLIFEQTNGTKRDEVCSLKLLKDLYTRPNLVQSSNETRDLINLEAYLIINHKNNEENTESYLPVNLKSVDMFNGPNDQQLISLRMDCVRLTFHVAKSTKELMIGSVDVWAIFRDSSGISRSISCSVSYTPIVLRDYENNYYTCSKPIDLPCLTTKWKPKMDSYETEMAASLRLIQFEFELNSNSRNNFGRVPYECHL